jgi:hypothetical protein
MLTPVEFTPRPEAVEEFASSWRLLLGADIRQEMSPHRGWSERYHACLPWAGVSSVGSHETRDHQIPGGLNAPFTGFPADF